MSVWNEGRGAEQRTQESESGCVWWASWHWLALALAAGTQEGKQATPAAAPGRQSETLRMKGTERDKEDMKTSK